MKWFSVLILELSHKARPIARLIMVLYFTSSEGYVMYMGADKYENEDLIRYGIPEDIWFHVDDMSSAHVYLRLRPNQLLEDVSPETIMECAQLVKANSIEGCKMREVTVSKYRKVYSLFLILMAMHFFYTVYTRWRNLHKTSSMEVGAIGFHDSSKVKRIRVEKDNSIVNRINKTKEVASSSLISSFVFSSYK